MKKKESVWKVIGYWFVMILMIPYFVVIAYPVKKFREQM